MSRLDEAKAEVAYLELETEFLKAKEKYQSGKLSLAKYNETKQRFHDARTAYRETRTTAGDGIASPSPARASASVNNS